MRILVLAPQPFFQERGTPIAVKLLLRVLCEAGHVVDAVVFQEGEDVALPGLTIHRTGRLRCLRGMRPGFSAKKLLADLFLLAAARRLCRRQRYDVVHAVEEAVFFGRLLGRRGPPYVCDMDSWMSQQVVQSHPALGFLRPWMERVERAAVAGALGALAVCDSLGDVARRYGAREVVILRDISLLAENAVPADTDFRRDLRVEGFCFLYIGNLEPYQGMDLLLESFAALSGLVAAPASLVVVGGVPSHIARYRRRAAELGIERRVRFVGPKPVAMMQGLLEQADAVVSPRIRGDNTPMKIYSYLDCGKPIVATQIASHREILDGDVAVLAEPQPAALAAAMGRVLADPEFGRRLAANAKRRAEERHHFSVYRRTLLDFYAWLEGEVRGQRPEDSGDLKPDT
jgi:glycosyltransferase involved in cell wall biosynthesis